MKFNKWTVGLAVIASLAIVSAARAQTNIVQVPDQLPPLPNGTSLPAFSTNGMSFTNAPYKIATGSSFRSTGGVLNYLQADVRVYSLQSFDFGVGVNGTVSATGTGLHTAAGFLELAKNFNNFQASIKGGAGFDFDDRTAYGAEIVEIDYNLTPITSGFLANNGLFSFVGANAEFDEGDFAPGEKYQKQIQAFFGIGF